MYARGFLVVFFWGSSAGKNGKIWKFFVFWSFYYSGKSLDWFFLNVSRTSGYQLRISQVEENSEIFSAVFLRKKKVLMLTRLLPFGNYCVK